MAWNLWNTILSALLQLWTCWTWSWLLLGNTGECSWTTTSWRWRSLSLLSTLNMSNFCPAILWKMSISTAAMALFARLVWLSFAFGSYDLPFEAFATLCRWLSTIFALGLCLTFAFHSSIWSLRISFVFTFLTFAFRLSLFTNSVHLHWSWFIGVNIIWRKHQARPRLLRATPALGLLLVIDVPCWPIKHEIQLRFQRSTHCLQEKLQPSALPALVCQLLSPRQTSPQVESADPPVVLTCWKKDMMWLLATKQGHKFEY